jgi:hypothetical protein
MDQIFKLVLEGQFDIDSARQFYKSEITDESPGSDWLWKKNPGSIFKEFDNLMIEALLKHRGYSKIHEEYYVAFAKDVTPVRIFQRNPSQKEVMQSAIRKMEQIFLEEAAKLPNGELFQAFAKMFIASYPPNARPSPEFKHEVSLDWQSFRALKTPLPKELPRESIYSKLKQMLPWGGRIF